MPFQEAVGRLKAFEERIKKPTEEGDTYGKLLFTKGDEKEKVQDCGCGCWSSNREDFGRGRGRGRGSGKGQDGGRFQQDKSHIKCFKCNELGHFLNECPKWDQKEQTANLIEDDEPMLL
ncbi:unnamed protein product [Cuscuta campestris]|uniref:CCHC-type domain-containing protein n=1 Tax=Cuscuta campestris TaxID=132261 RepID=A0A484LQ03_9ASTE|nr:unnamed protein product [Cuscuta campestris]